MGHMLRHIAKTATSVFAILLLPNMIPAQAAGHPQCARPAEIAAMDISALQQELMVAALSCGGDARTEFNDFQMSWKTSLQHSDKKMQNAFLEVLGAKGKKAYHTFKTKLATNAELKRIDNVPAYCSAAHYKAMALSALIHALKDAAAPVHARQASLRYFAVAAEEPDFAWPITACASEIQATTQTDTAEETGKDISVPHTTPAAATVSGPHQK